ncbi:2-amino-4-hydroxy-6-hydroxymethyldihydropteridine diphosphokinase [Aquamicrobium sp. LC103]|uniref:2-amino-4-hydroxy-6- hydroxymethyldihydropteridine diphosphokinase n=1 Tax=Aquamicrobium sp. LC103 TaxID=1120658 RepID=UPI00063E8B73|nr:2-amino-4-hydroxy-6-hydroxymethyldihydropteridine diphosphokinase [Aquamicrobium sp. LC103]TKT76871.1 2-amino-4-hydroxy-6-hydroxymethyldihydropteridine diphosphokinase [Aquamicrobium sp. LC103]
MTAIETSAFLGLGGNIGDPATAMAAALSAIDKSPDARVARVSPLYRTPPWGKTDQPDFLNAVAELRTTLSARELLELCLDTERVLKRVRNERWGPRVIDMDILVFGKEIIDEPGLQIPHPRMLDRAFVLAPLADVAPDLEIEGRTVSEHLAALDLAGITRIDGDPNWWRNV